nr:MAG TPA: hypothetical protein [Caudoviricetes sp.]
MKLAITVIRNTVKDFVTSLKKESMKASRKAINKCGLQLRNQARKNLKSSVSHITDSHFGDKLIQGVRAGKTFRKDNSFARYVRITKNKRAKGKSSGWFRLGWLNHGTQQRFKKTNGRSTGSMKATHFYDNALSSYQSKFGQEYNNEMNKALAKIKK